jgi:hypothetical protein
MGGDSDILYVTTCVPHGSKEKKRREAVLLEESDVLVGLNQVG